MIHGHGDDTFRYAQIDANFSSNVYQQLDLSGLTRYLCEKITAIHAYPEPDAGTLAKKIAQRYQVLHENICVTNGATEAIYLIAQAFRGSKTAILSPVFSEYADACSVHEHQVTHIFDLKELTQETQLVWLCNPNNPMGIVYPIDELREYISRYPDTCFVMDHSYASFLLDTSLLQDNETVSYSNVILLHSMTKHFAIPGLRLGYMSAHEELLAKINPFRMPWSVNQLAQEAGNYLLEHEQDLQIDLANLLAQTKTLQHNLSTISFLNILPTNTHFFLVQIKDGRTAAELKDFLAREHQILIRDASNFVGLDEHYFRVASQTAAKDDELVAAIKTW